MNSREYDMAIIGGGLAGLSLAIQLNRKGYSVVLFEKESYPFHRVCGEYISLESVGFLDSLGLDISTLQASRINRLEVTTSGGQVLRQPLEPGGIGVSRFILDHHLASIAKREGVRVLENTTVHAAGLKDNHFHIQTSAGEFTSRAAAGCFGKKSRMDLHWKRPFADPAREKKLNYVGIKYHFKSTEVPTDTIHLHHFPGGYCGIVKVESDRYCMCYLTTAESLALSGNNISVLEKNILSLNPVLKDLLQKAERLNAAPLVISQVSFAQKSLVEDHVLMLGDAAGMITPLCGNGMSMSLHASRMGAELFGQFLDGRIDRSALETNYTKKWKQSFSRRLWVGRKMQAIFEKPLLLSGLVRTGRLFPSITRSLVKQTHGDKF